MALPSQHLTPSEIAFLCESHPITIIPRTRMDQGLHLISGYIPPFNPPQRAQIPLWLALLLKKQKKCNIVPPEWLNSENLERLIRVETEQKERFVGGQELPFMWLEVAELLVEWAPDDVGGQGGLATRGSAGSAGGVNPGGPGEDIRVLLRTLREVRWSKAREGLRQLESTYLQMNGLGHLEISELRPFAKTVVDNLRHIGTSREEAKAREAEEDDYGRDYQRGRDGNDDDED